MLNPIGSMYGIYANIGGILMVNVTIYSIHGSYGNDGPFSPGDTWWTARPRDRLKSTRFDGDSVVLFFMIPLFVRPTSRSLKSLGQPMSTAHLLVLYDNMTLMAGKCKRSFHLM